MIFGINFDQFLTILGLKKNRRFVIFRVHFLPILSLLGPIAIYRKTGPTKSTVLGPDPPPGIFYKFIDFYWIFTILGPSIEPEKPSVKSASTPYPPSKVNFIDNLSIFYNFATQFHLNGFNLSRPNLSTFMRSTFRLSCSCLFWDW
jgi:hypothetical protein